MQNPSQRNKCVLAEGIDCMGCFWYSGVGDSYWGRKLCLSVGLLNKSVLSDPSFKVTVVSMKWTLFFEQSEVNLMVG